MNLLLLLSALLSALTGVGASARAPERAQAVAAVSVGRSSPAIARASATRRPVDAVPALIVMAAGAVLVAPAAIVRAVPCWIDRRRE